MRILAAGLAGIATVIIAMFAGPWIGVDSGTTNFFAGALSATAFILTRRTK